MGMLDFLKGKKEETKQAEVQPQNTSPETCAVCGDRGADKKFAGQFWHKKCLRKSKKVAKGFI